MVFGVVMAAIAWGAFIAATPNALRRHGDVQNTVGWRAILLLALALTALIPTVQLNLDAAVRLPNASQWLGHALLLATGYESDTFLTLLDSGLPYRQPPSIRQRWVARVHLLAAVTMMAVTLFCAHLRRTIPLPELLPPQVNLWVTAFQGVYVLELSGPILHVVRSGTQYARLAADPLVRVGPYCSALGASVGLGYLFVSFLETLAPTSSPQAAGLAVLMRLSGGFALLLLAVGATLPVWGRALGVSVLIEHVTTLSVYWRLTPLWRVLVSALPSVILPMHPSWRVAMLRPSMMQVLVRRRVIEILDAERLVLPAWWRVEMDHARHHVYNERVGKSVGSNAEREACFSTLARREAAALDGALTQITAQTDSRIGSAKRLEHQVVTTTEAESADAGQQALALSGLSATGVIVSYQEQLHYLAHVSRALRRRQWRRRLRRLRPRRQDRHGGRAGTGGHRVMST